MAECFTCWCDTDSQRLTIRLRQAGRQSDGFGMGSSTKVYLFCIDIERHIIDEILRHQQQAGAFLTRIKPARIARRHSWIQKQRDMGPVVLLACSCISTVKLAPHEQWAPGLGIRRSCKSARLWITAMGSIAEVQAHRSSSFEPALCCRQCRRVDLLPLQQCHPLCSRFAAGSRRL